MGWNLRAIVRPFAGAVGSVFLLVQHNARPHVASVCREFLDDDAINWASLSPGLNPVENLVVPQTVQELTYALIQIWVEIPQDTISCLIRSMSRHCQECMQARGGHTHYWGTFRVAMMKKKFWFWFWIQPLIGRWFSFPLTVVKSFFS